MAVCRDLLEALGQCPADYRMFQSIDIRNFRCFKNLELRNLPLINILVGDSASGKTALLEALFSLCTSDASKIANTSIWRGVLEGPASIVPENFDQLKNTWADFFTGLQIYNTIYIGATDSQNNVRSLSISMEPKPPKLPTESESLSVSPNSIEFEWNTSGVIHKVVIEPNNVIRTGNPSAIHGIFINPAIPNPRNDVQSFSELFKRKEVQPVIEAIRKEFPYVRNLGIEDRGQPKLTADIDYFDETVPVGLISSGFKKLISILVSIAVKREGVLLIDELENGFYYERLPRVWNLITEWSKAYQVQVFASTHSDECLRAMKDTLQANVDDFALLRTVKEGKHSIVRRFDGKQFLRNLESNIEVR